MALECQDRRTYAQMVLTKEVKFSWVWEQPHLSKKCSIITLVVEAKLLICLSHLRVLEARV